MKKSLFNLLALLILLLVVSDCNKTLDPKIVSTRETTNDGKTIVEATFNDGKQLYFKILSENTASVTNASDFSMEAHYYWKCYGDMVVPSEFSHNSQPYTVVKIEPSAFMFCNKLRSIVVPNSVTDIGECAFEECSDLRAVEIPNTIECINGRTFLRCKLLNTICFPEKLWMIETQAFSDCESLDSIRLPENLEVIHHGAFERCIHLTTVEMGGKLESIATEAFANCSQLSKITMPSVKAIYEGAFKNCVSLQSIDLPANIRELYRGAFSGCSSLTSVTCRAVLPPVTNYSGDPAGDPFPSCPIQEIKVPAESVSTYKVTLGWSKYADRIVGI